MSQNKKSYAGRPEICRVRPGSPLCESLRGKNKPKCRQCTAWQDYITVKVVPHKRRSVKRRNAGKVTRIWTIDER